MVQQQLLIPMGVIEQKIDINKSGYIDLSEFKKNRDDPICKIWK